MFSIVSSNTQLMLSFPDVFHLSGGRGAAFQCKSPSVSVILSAGISSFLGLLPFMRLPQGCLSL